MTTETLEDYLAGDYHQDMDDIRELEETLERTANVFLYAQAPGGTWSYAISRDDEPEEREKQKLSHGTQGMIAAALGKMTGRSRLPWGGKTRLEFPCGDHLSLALTSGLNALSCDAAKEKGLLSGSFGRNDPITASHISELRGTASNADDCTEASNILAWAESDLAKLVCLDPNGASPLLPNLPVYLPSIKGDPSADTPAPKAPTYLRNAFVPLRIVRIVAGFRRSKKQIFAKCDDSADADDSQTIVKPQLTPAAAEAAFESNYRRFFETTLHEQLSYSEIPDSRFDPAELIFCLEGLLTVSQKSVDRRLVFRVLDVLEARQEESAHWRPNRPLYATPQGMTMLPVSVEGAVSLMRSIAIIDGFDNFQEFSQKSVGILRRFWQWLLARSVDFKLPEKVVVAQQLEKDAAGDVGAEPRAGQGNYHKLLGWHSEHVNNPGLIHLWDTSQVAEFMIAYRDLLQRSVAGRTLKLSRLRINRPAHERPDKPLKKWDELTQSFEPLAGATEGEKVYVSIRKAFILPWSEDAKRKRYSMLLYGPPGTGKSTLGENIASALGMRMITVTVSDFLGRGGAYVEARAKAIFQTLEAQTDTVILFDEIDSFLLDRDSDRYSKQDTLFQFLTPGMLTKINDLRKRARSIFIIATNYENRIDPAIKRKGRIDEHYLLQLPDRQRRISILKDRLGLKDTDTLPDELWENSLFFGYSDLKAAVSEADGDSATFDGLKKVLSDKSRQPRTFESYLRRLSEENFPYVELFGLLRLKQQVDKTYDIDKLIEDERSRQTGDEFGESLRRAWKEFSDESGDGAQKDVGGSNA